MSNTNSESSRRLTLGLIQMPMVDDAELNLQKALKLIREAAAKGAQVICLPELFRTPYFPQIEHPSREYSEQTPGEVGEALSKIAADLEIVLVGGSIYEQIDGAKGFNTSLVYGTKGELLGKYRKMHIPHDPGFYERNYFAEGDLGYTVFETPWGKCAVLICYDQWFPEAARAVALKGAEIIFYPTAIGNVEGVVQQEGSWQEAWENVQRGHAIANNVVVATVNRVGTEGATTFWGGSFVCDAFGKTLTRALGKEEVVLSSIDLAHSEFTRDAWRLRVSRRPGTYKEIAE